MTVIVTKVPKANPYTGVPRSGLVRVLMATLTTAQWAALSGETGLGAGDLSDDQRLMFDLIIPPAPQLVRRTADKGAPGTRDTERVVSRTPLDRNALRLRISRRVAFYFEYQPGNSVGNDANQHPQVGEMMDMLESGTAPVEAAPDPMDPDNALSPIAYGQTILKTVPNQTKPSDLDFRAPGLDRRVSLAALPEAKGDVTVGELAARIAKTTGLEIIADRRVAALSVYVRGTEARAGDVLEALCRGVTGTIRRIGATQTFVLTDDREGIGTRYGRLAEWAEDIENAGAALIKKSDAAITKSNSIANLHFAPGDPMTPSAEQQERLESGWKKGEWAPMVEMSALSGPLQKAAERSFNQILLDVSLGGDSEMAAVRKDSFHLAEGMRADWIVPGVGALPDNAILSLGNTSLSDFVEKPPKVTAPVTPPTAISAPAPHPRRCVLLARAGSPRDAEAIVTSARKHGFNEVWFQVGLENPSASVDLLSAAVAAGQREKIAVGASIDLLRGPGLPGEADRNILGETGADFVKRQKARTAPPDLPLPAYENWVAPTKDTLPRIADRAAKILTVPGLVCTVIRAASAPGFARVPPDDPQERPKPDGIAINGDLGYTDATRVAFLRSHGIDPVDIPQIGPLRRLLSLPFFPNTTDYKNGRIGPPNGNFYGRDPAQKTDLAEWQTFRYNASEETIAALYARLRRNNPTAPLLIDDRADSYIRDLWASWFVTWDKNVALPRNRTHVPRAEAIKQARASHAHDILNRTAFSADITTPESFVARTTDSFAYAAREGWDGIVIDQSLSTPPETLRRLDVLPVPISTITERKP